MHSFAIYLCWPYPEGLLPYRSVTASTLTLMSAEAGYSTLLLLPGGSLGNSRYSRDGQRRGKQACIDIVVKLAGSGVVCSPRV